jgi:hypothetical protein
MASTADALTGLQPSDYGSSDIGLQDYSAIDNSGLAAPSYDTPMGVDPFTGTSIFDGNPLDPSLTNVPQDASGGVNSYNDGLLPLTNPNPASDAVISASQYSGTSFGPLDNLPLSTASNAVNDSLTKLGVATATPVANPAPLGSSLWASLFGTGSAAAGIGAAKSGTAGVLSSGKSSALTTVKAAPPTAIGNPISGTSTALIIGVVASLIGIVLWSFSGAK